MGLVQNEGVKVLVFEKNLMWSAKLRNALTSLGHEAVVVTGNTNPQEEAELAIVNLSQPEPNLVELIPLLHSTGTKVIAHAGHKEKELHKLGVSAGADLLVTNGELSSSLAKVLERLQK